MAGWPPACWGRRVKARSITLHNDLNQVIINIMTKLRHFDNLGTARFITFSCYRHLQGFQNHSTKDLFLKYLDAARDKHRFRLLGYVIMPDHVHLVIYPPDGMKLGLVIGEIKSKTAREHFARTIGPAQSANAKAKRVFWNRKCYDHNCRTVETTLEKINYCHMNPVRAGLVNDQGEWLWSSYNWYEGDRDGSIRIDTIGESYPE